MGATQPLQHAPFSSPTTAFGGSPLINKILSVAYDPGNPLSFTEETFFDVDELDIVAVSVFGVTGETPNNDSDFSVGLYRSLDEGYSWQLFATYNAATEGYFQCPSANLRWQFRLITKGANDVRVRARN